RSAAAGCLFASSGGISFATSRSRTLSHVECPAATWLSDENAARSSFPSRFSWPWHAVQYVCRNGAIFSFQARSNSRSLVSADNATPPSKLTDSRTTNLNILNQLQISLATPQCSILPTTIGH